MSEKFNLQFQLESLEQRLLLSAAGMQTTAGFSSIQTMNANSSEVPFSEGVYQVGFDPSVSAIVTAFITNDPENPADNYDIRTNWIKAVDELHSIGMSEVTFAVYRNVSAGNLLGGPSTDTVRDAVQHAHSKGLSVTILPVFEANGWRGNYDPSGNTQKRFQSQYSAWINDLASIQGIDRFNIGSELNRMVGNQRNFDFFTNLIAVTQNAFAQAGNTTGRIGYAANFDAYNDPQHIALLTQAGIDFMGVSAYRSIIDTPQASLVAGTGPVSEPAFKLMVQNWTNELDRLQNFAQANNLAVVIQEFGAVQQNYASIAPFAVNPSDWVAGNQPNRYQDDALEQRAVYESLIHALDGRGDQFESVFFWTWEHGASRGRRTFDALGSTGTQERFAIWPTDGGAGQFLTEYLATVTQQPNQKSLEVFVTGDTGQESISVTIDNQAIATFDNIGTNLSAFQIQVDSTVTADQVQVEFTNDFLDLTLGINRGINVEGIRLSGIDYHSDSANTFVSGTYINGVGRSEGYLRTGALHTNGYVRFAEPNQTGSTIDILARGVTGNEQFEVIVNGVSAGTFEVAVKEDLFRVSLDRQVRNDDIVQVRFLNDFYNPATNVNFAINVDKIYVDRIVYESEDSTTYSNASWTRNVGFVNGFVQSEWLHRNGFFAFTV